MYALETVDLQPTHNAKPRQARISGNIRRVIDLMVHSGQRRAEAAQAVGVHDDTVRKAMLKPEVLAYLNTQKEVLRTSARARAIAKADDLLDAESESVRLDAVKYLEPPISKSEITHTHQGHIQGLTIVFAAPSEAVPMIDVTPTNADKAKLIKSLPKPVAHPAMQSDVITHIMGNAEAEPSNNKSLTHPTRRATKASHPSTLDVGGTPPRSRKRRETPPGGQK